MTGPRAHAVAFDMSTEMNQKTFVEGCDQTLGELDKQALKPPAEQLVTFMRSSVLIEHVRNAKRAPGKYGVSIRKEHRESARKIDAAVCLVGARMLRRIYLLSRKTGAPGKGRVIVLE